MIERLEKNTRGQSVLPFKLKLLMSTPSKRPRSSPDDEDSQPSPSKMLRRLGSRMEPVSNEDRSLPETPAPAPSSPPGQALEEDNSTNVRRTQGGSIVGSLSFPQMGPNSSKSKSNEQQNNSSKQQNNSSDFNFKISRHSSHFSHIRHRSI